LKLKGVLQVLVYTAYINMLGGRVHNITENAEAFLQSSKEIGLDINADKSKYMIMPGDQNTGRTTI
jgi:hypothetical protein